MRRKAFFSGVVVAGMRFEGHGRREIGVGNAGVWGVLCSRGFLMGYVDKSKNTLRAREVCNRIPHPGVFPP